ncbi:MAG: hypothetical protein GY793_05760 [Proteobacteria bacterium]|nr:hypothetical protein [Pseudomonadota bacterium]
MKYNKGDKVFNVSNIHYFDNPYHCKEYLNKSIKTVFDASENAFTPYENTKLDIEGSYNQFMICSQDTGESRSYPSPDIWLHVEKDRERILNLINDHFEEVYKKAENDRLSLISSLENKIERLKGKTSTITKRIDDKKQKALDLLN